MKTKKLLLILELNETLMYVKHLKSKIKNFQEQSQPITFNEKSDTFGMLYRGGRPQLLSYMFHTDRQDLDVGVWTNFDSTLTQFACQKYFGRYMRDLLFILPTNRALYTSSAGEPQENIRIPRELSGIYNKFSGYDATNTLVLTCLPNTIVQHQKNDTLIPAFNPKHPNFGNDVGVVALIKYLRGLTSKLKDESLRDVRILNTSKPLANLYARYAHNAFSDIEYR